MRAFLLRDWVADNPGLLREDVDLLKDKDVDLKECDRSYGENAHLLPRVSLPRIVPTRIA